MRKNNFGLHGDYLRGALGDNETVGFHIGSDLYVFTNSLTAPTDGAVHDNDVLVALDSAWTSGLTLDQILYNPAA